METTATTTTTTTVRRRHQLLLGMDENARNIADLALATCEEKLAETRQRRPQQSKQQRQAGNSSISNPFLARLGTPFVISRSIQGAASTTTYIDNVHPLKDHRSNRNATNPPSDAQNNNNSSEWSKWRRRLSPLDAPTYTLFLLFLALIVAPHAFHILKDRLLHWHALSNRQLNGRRCVMNLFVDKQKPDEWNPDHGAKGSIVVADSYRTKGQLKLINRMIGSIADSFRTKVDFVQHVVFVGVRDGGHLAQTAGSYWPPRGAIRTRLHMFAAPAEDDLSYEHLHALEERFKTFDEFVYIYDEKGNLAGVEEDEEDEENDDDDGIGTQDDDALQEQKQNRRRLPTDKNLEQIGFEDLLFPGAGRRRNLEDEDDEEEEETEDNGREHIIPYFHIDGRKMATQLQILEKARPLLEKKSIAALGIEHSPDLDVNVLKDFFLDLEYKTFMLGLRQLTRVDNVCPETLENMFAHPTFSTPSLFTGHQKKVDVPPFFIALPKGRHSLPEMTIQTMYDLFSGAGGGGQVKTANDRKAPGKK